VCWVPLFSTVFIPRVRYVTVLLRLLILPWSLLFDCYLGVFLFIIPLLECVVICYWLPLPLDHIRFPAGWNFWFMIPALTLVFCLTPLPYDLCRSPPDRSSLITWFVVKFNAVVTYSPAIHIPFLPTVILLCHRCSIAIAGAVTVDYLCCDYLVLPEIYGDYLHYWAITLLISRYIAVVLFPVGLVMPVWCGYRLLTFLVTVTCVPLLLQFGDECYSHSLLFWWPCRFVYCRVRYRCHCTLRYCDSLFLVRYLPLLIPIVLTGVDTCHLLRYWWNCLIVDATITLTVPVAVLVILTLPEPDWFPCDRCCWFITDSYCSMTYTHDPTLFSLCDAACIYSAVVPAGGVDCSLPILLTMLRFCWNATYGCCNSVLRRYCYIVVIRWTGCWFHCLYCDRDLLTALYSDLLLIMPVYSLLLWMLFLVICYGICSCWYFLTWRCHYLLPVFVFICYLIEYDYWWWCYSVDWLPLFAFFLTVTDDCYCWFTITVWWYWYRYGYYSVDGKRRFTFHIILPDIIGIPVVFVVNYGDCGDLFHARYGIDSPHILRDTCILILVVTVLQAEYVICCDTIPYWYLVTDSGWCTCWCYVQFAVIPIAIYRPGIWFVRWWCTMIPGVHWLRAIYCGDVVVRCCCYRSGCSSWPVVMIPFRSVDRYSELWWLENYSSWVLVVNFVNPWLEPSNSLFVEYSLLTFVALFYRYWLLIVALLILETTVIR